MSSRNSNTILVDTPEQNQLGGNAIKDNDASKCIIKLEGDIITDLQETKDNLFDCDLSTFVGKPLIDIFPEYQPNGNLSKNVITTIFESLNLGHPISTTLQVKTTSNKLHYADVNVFSFEKNNYYITLSPKKFEVSSIKQTIAGKEAINIQNLIADGSLMFKCYDIDGSVYYLNSAYLDFTATSFNQQLKERWLKTVNIADRDRLKKVIVNALKNHEKYSINYKLEKADNTFTSVYESGIPVFNKNGSFNGIAAAIIDLSELNSDPTAAFPKSTEELNELTDSAPVLFKMSNSKNEFYYFSNQWINFT